MKNRIQGILPKSKGDVVCCFFILFLIDWVAKFFQNTWFHNFVGAPFYNVGTDFSYWVWIVSGIPQFLLSNHLWTWTLDILMLLLGCYNLFRPRRITLIVWTLMYLMWVITTNAVVGSHFHSYNGLIIIGVCCCFYQSRYFVTAWEMARYYVMYIFASAALWKILRGIPFDINHLQSLQFQNNIWYTLQDSWYAWVFKLSTANKWISYCCMQIVIILQLSFVIGFITKKYDKWLIGLFVFFCIADYVVFRHFFFELTVLILPLLVPFKNMDLDPSKMTTKGQNMDAMHK